MFAGGQIIQQPIQIQVPHKILLCFFVEVFFCGDLRGRVLREGSLLGDLKRCADATNAVLSIHSIVAFLLGNPTLDLPMNAKIHHGY